MNRQNERNDRREATSAGVVILGMHRSGTSLLSGLLGELGFEFGGSVVGSTASNPKGHWEHAGVVHTHDSFLMNVGRHWSDPRPMPDELFHSEAAAQARRRLRSIFERDFVPRSKWVLKDPRHCRLLPLWDRIWADRRSVFRFVHIVRNPFDVAASLAVRDRLSLEHSLLLWLRHSLDAELGTRDGVRAWIAFDDLVESPAKTVAGLSRRLRISGLVSDDMPAAIAEALDASLVHHHDERTGEAQTHEWSSVSWVGETWKALRQLTLGKESQARQKLDHVRAELAALYGFAARPVEHFLRDQTVSYQRIAEQKDTDLHWLQSRQTDLEGELDKARGAVTQAGAERDKTLLERAELQAALDRAETEPSAVKDELDKAQRALAHADSERARLRKERDQGLAERSQLQTAHDALRRELAKNRSVTHIMVHSRSWRWTQPLRARRESFDSQEDVQHPPDVRVRNRIGTAILRRLPFLGSTQPRGVGTDPPRTPQRPRAGRTRPATLRPSTVQTDRRKLTSFPRNGARLREACRSVRSRSTYRSFTRFQRTTSGGVLGSPSGTTSRGALRSSRGTTSLGCLASSVSTIFAFRKSARPKPS